MNSSASLTLMLCVVFIFFICLSTLPDLLHCFIFSVPFHFDFGCQPSLCSHPVAVWVSLALLCLCSWHTVSLARCFKPVFGAVIFSSLFVSVHVAVPTPLRHNSTMVSVKQKSVAIPQLGLLSFYARIAGCKWLDLIVLNTLL